MNGNLQVKSFDIYHGGPQIFGLFVVELSNQDLTIFLDIDQP